MSDAAERGVETPERSLRIREPDTGRSLGEVAVVGSREVGEMVAEARQAAAEWSRRPVEERVAALRSLRRLVAARSDRVAAAVGRETGKPEQDVLLAEVFPACEQIHYLESVAARVLRPRGRRHRWLVPYRRRVTREAYGVAGIITPWNFPFLIPAGTAATALAAGNAVVIKPSELTPHSSLALEELARDALPDPRLLRVATGDDSTGEALVDAPVDVLSVTGGVDTGRRVMEAAARHLTPLVLELGGKDPMVVLDDADLEGAARAAVWGSFFHAGQVCQSVERVFVERSVYDRFVERVVAEASGLDVGGRGSGAAVGPLTRPEQAELIEEQLDEARRLGARVLLGGRRAEGPGTFFEPTVVADATPEMRIMREETFGPVLPLAPFDREEDVVRMVNASPYGLDAYVFGAPARARRLARRLEAGSVMVNDCIVNYGLPALPFGGVKASGFGRIHGEEGLRSFSRARSEAEPRTTRFAGMHRFPGRGRLRWIRALLTLLHGEGVVGRVVGALREIRGEGPRR